MTAAALYTALQSSTELSVDIRNIITAMRPTWQLYFDECTTGAYNPVNTPIPVAAANIAHHTPLRRFLNTVDAAGQFVHAALRQKYMAPPAPAPAWPSKKVSQLRKRQRKAAIFLNRALNPIRSTYSYTPPQYTHVPDQTYAPSPTPSDTSYVC